MSLVNKMLQTMEKDIEMVQALHLRQKNIKSSLCDYSDAYILVRGNITAINDDENIDIALKSCSPFIKMYKSYKWSAY